MIKIERLLYLLTIFSLFIALCFLTVENINLRKELYTGTDYKAENSYRWGELYLYVGSSYLRDQCVIQSGIWTWHEFCSYCTIYYLHIGRFKIELVWDYE